jgi:hypothetical protein
VVLMLLEIYVQDLLWGVSFSKHGLMWLKVM